MMPGLYQMWSGKLEGVYAEYYTEIFIKEFLDDRLDQIEASIESFRKQVKV